jgi:hypothetical protein
MRWETAICRVYAGPPDQGGEAVGTACFVTPERLLTAAHVARAGSGRGLYLRGLPNDGVERVLEVRRAPSRDVALLRIGAAQPLRPLPLDPRPVGVGERLRLAGFPDPGSGLRTPSLEVSARDGASDSLVVQGYPGKGFSGGPALRTGCMGPRLAGICFARHTDRNEGFLVPLAALPELLDGLPLDRARRRLLALGLGVSGGLGALGLGAWWLIRPPSVPLQPLAGTILGADGEPLAGVEIHLPAQGLHTETDDLGRFRLQVPADAGRILTLVVRHPDHRTLERYPAAGTRGLRYRLEPKETKE